MTERDLYGSGATPAPARRSWLERTIPLIGQLRHYSSGALRVDLVAGATVAALALPSGMAFAQLAGLSPVAGLYALLLPVIAYAILGSSRQLIVGPEGAIAVLVATAVAPLAGADPAAYAALAAMLALLVALIAFIAWVARLGWIADYFSRSVLIGYIHGVAVVLIIGQLPKLLGLSVDAEDPLAQLVEMARELGDTHAATVAVSVVSLAVLLLLRWRAPKVPGALLVVIGGIIASNLFGFADEGIKVVGDIASGLPSLAWPGVSAQDAAALVPAALGIFAVGYADAILTARSFAGRHGQSVDANQEILAFGAANAAAGISQAFPVGASGSRTAVNDQMRGTSQVVGLVATIVIAVVLLFLTGPVEALPSACLGAVIVAAAIGLIDPAAWRALARVGRYEVVIAAVTFVGVVAFGVLTALVVAVALSIVDQVVRRAKPHDAVLGRVERLGRYGNVALHRTAELTPGVVVYRFDGSLFFANAQYLSGRILEAIDGSPTTTRWLVLDAEGINDTDASGAEAVEGLVSTLRARGITLVVARMKSPVLERWDDAGLTSLVGSDHFAPSVRAAVERCAAEDARRASPGPDGTP